MIALHRVSIRAVAALVALAAAFVLSACFHSGGEKKGGGGGEPAANADKIINDTFSGGASKKVDSGKVAMNLNITPKNVPKLTKPITAKLTGAFQSLGEKKMPKLDFNLEASAEGQNFSAGAVSTGEKGYIKYQGTAYVVSDELFGAFKSGIENAAAQQTNTTDTTFAALGINPRNWLTNLKVADGVPVGGVETNHVSAGIDVNKLLADVDVLLKKAKTLNLNTGGQKLPESIPQEAKDKALKAIKNPVFDVYSGKEDSILRKLAFKLTVVVPDQSNQSMDISLDVELTELNKPQTITEPTGAKPLDELLQQLGLGGMGGLGGLGGGGGKSTTPGGTGGGTSTKQAQKYLDCVSKAKGQDEMQKCTELLANP